MYFNIMYIFAAILMAGNNKEDVDVDVELSPVEILVAVDILMAVIPPQAQPTARYTNCTSSRSCRQRGVGTCCCNFSWPPGPQCVATADECNHYRGGKARRGRCLSPR